MFQAHYVTESGLDPEYAVLLTFLTGIIITALGLLKLGQYFFPKKRLSNHNLSFENYDFTYTYISGFVIDFISVPVTAGFCSAAAITIASSQLKSIFGLEISEHYHGKGDEGKKREFYFTKKILQEPSINDVIHLGEGNLPEDDVTP